MSDPARPPAGQAARLPAVPASEQRDDEVPEASIVNDAAVAAYRLSVQAGNPLSERRLAHMFGCTAGPRPQPPPPPRQATLTATDPATPPVRCPRSFGRGAGMGIRTR